MGLESLNEALEVFDAYAAVNEAVIEEGIKKDYRGSHAITKKWIAAIKKYGKNSPRTRAIFKEMTRIEAKIAQRKGDSFDRAVASRKRDPIAYMKWLIKVDEGSGKPTAYLRKRLQELEAALA